MDSDPEEELPASIEEICADVDASAAKATEDGLGTACTALSAVSVLSLFSICRPHRAHVLGPPADDATSSLASVIVRAGAEKTLLLAWWVMLIKGPPPSREGEVGPGAGDMADISWYERRVELLQTLVTIGGLYDAIDFCRRCGRSDQDEYRGEVDDGDYNAPHSDVNRVYGDVSIDMPGKVSVDGRCSPIPHAERGGIKGSSPVCEGRKYRRRQERSVSVGRGSELSV